MSSRARLLLITMLCWAIFVSNAWAGQVMVDSYHSVLLGRSVSFSAYLPNGYHTGTQRFPAIYLLHGLGGDHNESLSNGTIAVMNTLIARGELHPMVAITPSFGKQSWWIDGSQDQAETALIQELLPHVERKYRIREDSGARAVAGWSMGGYGTLNLVLKHGTLFCAAAVINPELHHERPPRNLGVRHMTQFMRHGDFDPDLWQSLHYSAHLPGYTASPRHVPVWMIAGDNDRLLGIMPAVRRLHGELAAIQPDQVELRVISGELDNVALRHALPDALRYIDRQCQRQ